MKKLFSVVAILAASTMLANAASVAFTFNLGEGATIDGVTNLAAEGLGNGSGQSASNLLANETQETMNNLGENASLSVSLTTGKLWGKQGGSNPTPFTTTTLSSNPDALSILGLTAGNLQKINYGMQDAAGGAQTTFNVTGLNANTTYNVSLLIGIASGSSAQISWDTGNLVSGLYAYGASATQTISGTSYTFQSSQVPVAVSLKITTDASGAFNVSMKNDGSSKSSIGYFGISDMTIPEPSAFGLLAGLGAIALAVSRRRRSR